MTHHTNSTGAGHKHTHTSGNHDRDHDHRGEKPMSERAVPFHCPYCGEEDLQPHEDHGGWYCRSCARAFKLTFLGLGARS